MGLEPSAEPAGDSVDPEATVKLSPSQASISARGQPDLPLPEELTTMLPGGAYKVESFLGQGGMGAVYKGAQVRLKRPVAIKIMRRDLGRDYDFEARFEREAQAMAKLSHPNIVSVIDFGEAGPDYLYIVMELVDGADLMDVIRGGQMTQEMALTLLPQICDALQFAHDHGIVHRDIKPSNIMLTRDGRIKMADFGLAKRLDTESTMHTKTGTGMGTPDYAAPEQFDPNGHIDHRADIYALGVMIYQMITGTLPRGAWKSPSERAAVAPQWDDIVSRAMQSDPADRYQQASEVKTDVTSIPLASTARQDRQPEAKASPRAVSAAPTKTKSRMPLILGLAACAVVASVGALLMTKKPGVNAAAQTSQAPSSAPARENWEDLLREPTQFAFTGGAKRTSDGIRIERGGTARLDIQKLAVRDGALRMHAVFGSKIQLRLREKDNQGQYWLHVSNSNQAILGRRDMLARKDTPLTVFTLPRTLKDGDEYEMELRVVGPCITAKFDGEPMGSVLDELYADGSLSVGTFPDNSRPAIIKSLEFLDLDNTASKARIKSSPQAAPFTNSLGMKFVPVPGTKVLFSIWETRVQDYAAFANDTKREWKDPSVSSRPPATPVTKVDITDARAFAAWLTDRERSEGRIGAQDLYRLPRDHEWSCAMGIGDREDPAKTPAELSQLLPDVYPWGTAWPPPPGAGNYAGEEAAVQLPDGKPFSRSQITGYRDPFATSHAPVGSFAPNALGLHDLGGNVWEWCDDLMATAGQEYVKRGGCYDNSDPDALRSASRRAGFLNSVGFSTGFRLVLESASPGLTKNDIVAPTFPAKGAPFTNSLGMKFVPVPGTKVLFSIWDTRVQDYAAYAAARPGMDDLWKKQEKEGVPVGREADHPVVRMTWEDAQAFCAWLTEKETAEGKLTKGAKYRLPTDAEWSTAVGMPPEQGATPQERHFKNEVDFPWGKDWPPKGKAGNYADESFHKKFPKPDVRDPEKTTNAWIAGYDDGYATTSPVGAFPANTQGLYDMGGNVWQWCEDWFDDSHKHRVLRGGSWNHDARGNLLSSNRAYAPPASRNLNYGFRCVLAQPAD
ncbi:hypothetical protein BGE01nite_00120 [Brevifollis gellanilyticus]|uniref:Protein kinase domain-containing protein n=2 Tax=Brevifollis gellanilyticus TaxID=748831 RepID=A0A512M326_9BACT|nr:hypothetical protein BGE01nite_00120 [Brevifollis gellanilyticus]